jgi:hypothetical protein
MAEPDDWMAVSAAGGASGIGRAIEARTLASFAIELIGPRRRPTVANFVFRAPAGATWM